MCLTLTIDKKWLDDFRDDLSNTDSWQALNIRPGADLSNTDSWQKVIRWLPWWFVQHWQLTST